MVTKRRLTMAKKLNERIVKVNKELIPKWIKVLKCPICNKKPTIWIDSKALKSDYNWIIRGPYFYITCFNCENTTETEWTGINSYTANTSGPDIGIEIARWNTSVENYINKEANNG
jgi:hypothetical protein